jgi:glyoxylase-like metal-dependent hydrolase (beta-lactamase superfamily II)
MDLDGGTWRILDVAGHSPGGRALYCAEERVAIVGDALFQGSVGRVDFHNSDGEMLLKNIRGNLMTLPDDTRVFSGHGPATTIGRERNTNPYILHGF